MYETGEQAIVADSPPGVQAVRVRTCTLEVVEVKQMMDD